MRGRYTGRCKKKSGRARERKTNRKNNFFFSTDLDREREQHRLDRRVVLDPRLAPDAQSRQRVEQQERLGYARAREGDRGGEGLFFVFVLKREGGSIFSEFERETRAASLSLFLSFSLSALSSSSPPNLTLT